MKKKLMSIVVSIALTLCAIPFSVSDALAVSCRKDSFDKSKYTLSGNMAKDVATIAKSQNGRTTSQFGYTEAWCDEFVADCIENAGGGSDIVAHGGTVTDFFKVMEKKGAEVVTTPQAGDLIFYYRASTKSYPHVAIMLDSTNSAQGNIDGQVYCMNYKSYGDGNGNKIGNGLTAVFVRPAYKNTLPDPQPSISYISVKTGDYFLKNKSTGTYMTVDGGTASNGQNISVASKASSNAFKFNISGGTSNYLASKLNTSYVVNPYSDTPGNGTNITLYTKDSSGTQTWKFEAVSGGYIIHSGYDESCVLTVDGTNVKLATKTGKDNQIWSLEDIETYTSMSSEDVWLKNKSTGTYMTVDGGKASNGQNISVASKTSSDAFKFNLSGGTSNYITSKLNTSYVVNPYSDTPGNGTNITLYTKDSSGTQTWKFEAVSGGYIIHSGYNESCVLTVDGTNVKLATKTGKDNQIWAVEKVTSETTTTTTTTTTSTTKTTTTTTATSAPALSIDISELTLFVGEQYTIKANQNNLTYKSSNTDTAIVNKSGVITAVSKGNAVITVYNSDGDAVQLKLTVIDNVKGDVNNDNEFTVADAVMLQKWILGSGELTNWQNADLCEDGVIDVFDMVEMRKKLID